MKRIARRRKIMKKIIIASLTASVMFLFTASAFADVMEVMNCKFNDDKTGADLVAVSSAWLKAAKSMEGGEDLEVYLDFPLVADTEDGEFLFVAVFADMKTFGVFMNGYSGSPAAEADEAWYEVATCSGNSLWDSFEIE
jgi:hypothetical protein